MLIGAMNHPARSVLDEIAWMGDMGLGFIDLTLEPPCSASWTIDAGRVKQALDRYGLGVVGHTGWYLPFASAVPELRQGTVTELKRCCDVFAELGAKWINLHPDRNVPWHGRPFWIDRNLETFREVAVYAAEKGLGWMIENLPGEYNNAGQLAELLDRMPELMLHLDIGHANLHPGYNTTEEILARFGDRLRHVHLHDNNGQADLHLPLGAGSVDARRTLAAVARTGYDGTFTLEVFSQDKRLFEHSARVLRDVWDECRREVKAA